MIASVLDTRFGLQFALRASTLAFILDQHFGAKFGLQFKFGGSFGLLTSTRFELPRLLWSSTHLLWASIHRGIAPFSLCHQHRLVLAAPAAQASAARAGAWTWLWLATSESSLALAALLSINPIIPWYTVASNPGRALLSVPKPKKISIVDLSSSLFASDC